MSKSIMIGNHNSNRNIKKKLFLGITKTSPTKIIIQTDNETCTNIVIDNTDHNTQKTKTNINNVHFDDDIGQYPQKHSTRIFFQNVNGLEFSTTSHTLLTTYIGMQDKQIDIACLAEINTNWNHYTGKRQLNRIVRKHWKRAHLTTSNIENKVITPYQPGGTAIISTHKISSRITDSGVDPQGMGRWSYITINGRNKKVDNNQCLPCGENSYSGKRTINSLHTTMGLHGGKIRHNHRC